MKIQKTIVTFIAVMALGAIAVQAQSNALFKVQLNATCRPPRDNSDNQINNRDLIRNCVGDGFSKKELDNDFSLVFNVEADSLQVVSNADGSLVCDVFLFEGGTNVVGRSNLQRLVFVFLPGDPNAVGGAVITERIGKRNKDRQLNGKIWFTMGDTSGTNTISTSDVRPVEVDGSFIQSVVAVSVSDVQICSGTFTVGKLFVSDDNQATVNNAKKSINNAKKNLNNSVNQAVQNLSTTAN
jgi:hypothetical protein